MTYMGFKKVEAAAAASGARDPGAVAAAAGRKKYGKKRFQEAAAKGVKMKGMKHRSARDGAEALRERGDSAEHEAGETASVERAEHRRGKGY